MKKIIVLLIVFLAAQAAHATDKLTSIQTRGILRVGTTGDYIPMSYKNPETGVYEGFDIELAKLIAGTLKVKIEFVPTTWPTLTQDTLDGKFDFAICGISRTFERERLMNLSDGYLLEWKTVLCRKEDVGKFKSLDDLNKPDVNIMVNPGGTNEKFIKAHLNVATVIVHNVNEEIPGLISRGSADVMITDTVEARKYVKLYDNLAAPLIDRPLTKKSFGLFTKAVLMQKGDQDFLNYINFVLDEFKLDGTIDELKEKYF